MPRAARRWVSGLVATCLLGTGCTVDRDEPAPVTPSPSGTGGPSGSPSGSPTAADGSSAPSAPAVEAAPPHPVSLPAYFDRRIRGDRLRLGAVRERTAAYTSYDASYRVDGRRVTGVLNVPTGRGPFPAVVLAHGYIDPAIYVSGQGMTRERGYLAGAGYVALHVDYRNHAGSDVDPRAARQLRLGYSVDVIAAVQALRRSPRVPVDDERVALMGRSMGGGVVYKALAMKPGLVGAAAVWAPVSSLESENFDRWIRPDAGRSDLRETIARRYGLPGQPRARRFWREVSARTYFDRITEPLLVVQGGSDDTCPPRWARATYRALLRAGADARLAWYADEEHAFGPRFTAAMARTVRFLDRELA